MVIGQETCFSVAEIEGAHFDSRSGALEMRIRAGAVSNRSLQVWKVNLPAGG